jgi:RluA family pseudouridine synthase
VHKRSDAVAALPVAKKQRQESAGATAVATKDGARARAAGDDDEDSPVVQFAEKILPQELAEFTYVFRNGLRYIKPYHYQMKVFAKGRWFGKPLLDVVTQEFKAYDRAYNAQAIEAGVIQLNGQNTTPDRLVRCHDVLTHRLHRHEPPVVGAAISIVSQTDDLVVVNKPASIPVHPTGRFRRNTVLLIMAKEHGMTNLHPVHRLDRLTSGVLLLARSPARAVALYRQITGHSVRKQYLARVSGDFPHAEIEVKEPILTVEKFSGRSEVNPAGKAASTLFRKLHFNGTSTLLECLPRTGRTHQIRVHLLWLKFPILNDPLYGRVPRMAPQRLALPPYEDELCPECRNPHEDPSVEELSMCLHALSYSGEEGWRFEVPRPDWAEESWQG